MIQTRFDLSIDELPKQYFNILSDFNKVPGEFAPPLHPVTLQPVGPEDLAPLFPKELIKQEVSTDKFITIPEPVREIYARYRPSPLYRAIRLEEKLKTSAKIYYKYEGVSPAGSHKPNTAIAQAYYNSQEGVTKLFTETGAGQWGTALAYAGTFFDIDVEVFMVRVSYNQKPYRRSMMEVYGAKVHPSPSKETSVGNKLLGQNPNHPGSLGIAISEAIEKTVMSAGTAKYSLGSVLNHVLLHQTVIGLETQKQLQNIDVKPDILIGCLGGGSYFGGFSFPFVSENLNKRLNAEIIAVESTAAPKLTQGKVAYDFGDTGEMTPLIKMHTIGHKFIPAEIHAGGLRYHGAAPTVSHLLNHNIIKAEAYDQLEVFEAAALFSKAEGIIPAPESAHAVCSAIKKARQYPRNGHASDGPNIVFNLSGHGLLDLAGYDNYLANYLENYSLDLKNIEKNLEALPKIHN